MPAPELHCPLWCWQVCKCVQVKVGAHGQVEASRHGRKVGVGKCTWVTVGREVKLMHRTIFLAEFVLGSFGHALFNPEGEGGKGAWVGRESKHKRKEKNIWKSPHPFQSWMGEVGEVQANAHRQVKAGKGGTGRETRDEVGKEELVWVTSQKGGARAHDPSALQHETKQPSHRGKRKGPSMV
ncbi:hypothetical protein BJV74DRAFT_793124 [Russula compacta]|nr:hypothetical protein BJV74DRAFT_793124 [Russula compacta]